MLTPSQKGAVAEAAVAYAAVRLGISVYRPVAEGGRYDLILDVGTQLLRVQCKSAVRHGEIISVPCYSSRRDRDGFLKRRYSAAEVDAIAAYSPELDRCFLLFLDRFPGRSSVQLRLGPTRNNQRVGVNWAEEFDLAARLRELTTGP